MPIEMALWRLDGSDAVPLPTSSLDSEKRLEDILEKDISILGLDRLVVVGRQVPTRWGKLIDLLALDPQGDLYLIELKRDRTPREIVAQALDYGSWIKGLDYEALIGIYDDYREGEEFDTMLKQAFGEQVPDDFNTNQQLIIVASELDASTERIVEYLTDFEVPINVVFFRYLRDGDGEYLARSWLASPSETESKTTRKKRPWNGRDFYISFGEGDTRQWEDAVKYGFVSGGGERWYSRSLNALQPGHRVFVHIPQSGYVGVGKVVESAQPVSKFTVGADGKTLPILDAPDLKATTMGRNLDDPDRCEYLVRVKWEKTRAREDAWWEPGLFANQNTAAKLRDGQTIKRLEAHFGLDSDG